VPGTLGDKVPAYARHGRWYRRGFGRSDVVAPRPALQQLIVPDTHVTDDVFAASETVL
jgi:hypothetical protein